MAELIRSWLASSNPGRAAVAARIDFEVTGVCIRPILTSGAGRPRRLPLTSPVSQPKA